MAALPFIRKGGLNADSIGGIAMAEKTMNREIIILAIALFISFAVISLMIITY